MKLREKIYKSVTYVFITFIVGIIVISFGMPDFLGKASDNDKFLAARVGDEIITRKEVQSMKMNMLRLPQFQGFASQEEFLNRYALDYLISEKLQVVQQKETGMYPLSDAKSTVLARYLKKNFKEYQTNEGFDFTRFDKEFLKPRHIGFTDVEAQAVRETLYNNRRLADNLEFASSHEQADHNLLKHAKISYEILVFTPEEKKNILKKMAGISEKEIIEVFNKDYLTKDKNDKLTDLKREAISQSLLGKKIASLQNKWIKDLNAEISTENLSRINRKHGGILLSLTNIGIADSLNQAAKNSKANLQLLEDNEQFMNSLATLKINKIMGPWIIQDHVYLVMISNLNQPPENITAIVSSDIQSEIKNRNKNALDQLLEDLLKRDIKVTKYSNTED